MLVLILGLGLCYVTTYYLRVITVACDSYTARWTAFVQMTSYSSNQSLFGIQSILLFAIFSNFITCRCQFTIKRTSAAIKVINRRS
ncbi:hypothetical protein KQX54_019260 [Cotesia glomerata]|uniref:Uncharacterized protein n=1 Tax=Cotesia glomerata TaxID=32391 RepID=A0AAV7I822_COTGL|nr:hypothetical protein KQX54_019260 [Cotesia glomerata]